MMGITGIIFVGVHEYCTVWHPDSTVECIPLGYQWHDGSLGVDKPSPEIYEPQQSLLDSILHHFRPYRYARHFAIICARWGSVSELIGRECSQNTRLFNDIYRMGLFLEAALVGWSS